MRNRVPFPVLAFLLCLGLTGVAVAEGVGAPIVREEIFNFVYTSGEDVMDADLSTMRYRNGSLEAADRYPVSAYRVLVGIAASSTNTATLSAVYTTSDGGTSVALTLNGGSDLTKGALYGFTVAAVSTLTLNFTFDDDVTIGLFTVAEVRE